MGPRSGPGGLPCIGPPRCSPGARHPPFGVPGRLEKALSYALLVDGGYLLGECAWRAAGRYGRSAIRVDYDMLLTAIADRVESFGAGELATVVWFDAAPDAKPTPELERIAALEGVELRLGRLAGRRRRGVELAIYREMLALSRNPEIDTIVLVAGNAELAIPIGDVRQLGKRIIVAQPGWDSDDEDVAAVRDAADETVVLPWPLLADAIELPAAELRDKPRRFDLRQEPRRPDRRRGSRRSAANWEEIAVRAGRDFANRLMAPDSPVDLDDLLDVRPVLPRHIDVSLLQLLETRLGHEPTQAERRAARAALWRELAGDEANAPT